jgi:hypothetical protein
MLWTIVILMIGHEIYQHRSRGFHVATWFPPGNIVTLTKTIYSTCKRLLLDAISSISWPFGTSGRECMSCWFLIFTPRVKFPKPNNRFSHNYSSQELSSFHIILLLCFLINSLGSALWLLLKRFWSLQQKEEIWRVLISFILSTLHRLQWSQSFR